MVFWFIAIVETHAPAPECTFIIRYYFDFFIQYITNCHKVYWETYTGAEINTDKTIKIDKHQSKRNSLDHFGFV